MRCVAGQFWWFDVYEMTQGHQSYQCEPPLGTWRSRGNLFSLARLSSRTRACCSFRLSYLVVSLFSLCGCFFFILLLFCFNVSYHNFLYLSLSLPLSLRFHVFLVFLEPPPSSSILLSLHALSHWDKGEPPLCCVCVLGCRVCCS